MADPLTSYNNYFNIKENELLIGGIPVSQMVSKIGTPLFVYDAAIMEQKLNLLLTALPKDFRIFFSIKANPNPSIVSFFTKKDCGLEIASGGELFLALKSGGRPSDIIFAGPGKTEAELEFAIDTRISEIHLESKEEIERVATITARKKTQTAVALRINPGEEALGGAMRMGGKPSQFGFDEEIIATFIKSLLSDQNLIFKGIHLFSGTQILDYSVLLKQYRKALKIAEYVAELIEGPIHTIDFGGGYGIPYFPGERELDMEAFGLGLKPMIDEFKQKLAFQETTYIVEPGRFLVGDSGIYVTRVVSVKKSRGQTFVIVDGGMNHHLAASGNLGQVIKRNFPIASLNKINDDNEEMVDIVGPLCTPLDTIARRISIPSVQVGDLIGIFQSGAYARTASPMGFLSHLSPPEVMVDNGIFNLIRRRGSYKDFLEDAIY